MPLESEIIYVDRSRIVAWEHCPRHRWWAYEYEGRGLAPASVSPDAELGKAVHLMIALMLGAGVQPYSSDTAIGLAVAEFRAAMLGYRDELSEEWYDVAEACGRAWDTVVRPREQNQYEVVSVEQEHTAEFLVHGTTVKLLARPDRVLRRRSDSALFLKNEKTSRECGDRWREQWAKDMVTLSESLAVEQEGDRANSFCKHCGALLKTPPPPIKVEGVIIEGIKTGKWTEYPRGSGKYHHDNPLVWCWFYDDGINQEWYTSYYYTCKEPHKTGRGECLGNKVHKRPGGDLLTKRRVAEVYPGGIKAWVHRLMETEPETVESMIVELPPILRSEYDVERWKRQTLFSEREVRINTGTVKINPITLDQLFPMSTSNGNCFPFGRKCPFFEMCWGTAADDPLASGFAWRKPNHPQEELLVEKEERINE